MLRGPHPSSRHRQHAAILCVCLLAFSVSLRAQIERARFRVMSYNVENLFDTEHDTLKNDLEFLPQAQRRWNKSRYFKKLDNIARVITACGEWEPPAIVGLCEVENTRTMDDLTTRSTLREHGYRYVMTQSPDERGINVALLYQRGLFKPLAVRSIAVPPQKGQKPTRDILHVAGQLPDGSTLDIFVCHLPSRSGGEKETEPHRLRAAGILRQAIDSVAATRERPQIIAMGDFNDNHNNRSIQTILKARKTEEAVDTQAIYDLLATKAQKRSDYGSYRYQGEWDMLDHLLVSGTLLQREGSFHIVHNDGEEAGRREEENMGISAGVFAPPFLLEGDARHGGLQPFRTYLGPVYKGGYSDHLPIYADFEVFY